MGCFCLNTSVSQVVFTSLAGVCVAAVSRRAGALVKQLCSASVAAGRRRRTAITCTLRRERRTACGRRRVAAGQDRIRRAVRDGQRCTGDSSTLQILWEHTQHLDKSTYRDIHIIDAVTKSCTKSSQYQACHSGPVLLTTLGKPSLGVQIVLSAEKAFLHLTLLIWPLKCFPFKQVFKWITCVTNVCIRQITGICTIISRFYSSHTQ